MTVTEPTLRGRTAAEIFSRLDARDIDYCILRNHESVHLDPGRDVDIVVAPAAVAAVRAVATEVANLQGWATVAECHHHTGVSFYLLRPDHTTGPVTQLEIHCTKVGWAGLPVLDEGELLADRRRTASGLWVASPEHQCLQIALQRGLAQSYHTLKPQHADDLRSCTGTLGAPLEAALAVKMDERAARETLAAVRALPAPDHALALRRRAFVTASARRLGAARLVGAVAAAAAEKVQRRARPRCGVIVIGRGDVDELVARLHRLVGTMFLNLVRLPRTATGLRGYATAADIVNRAGLVVIDAATQQDVARATQRWSLTLDAQADDHTLARTVSDAFVEHHAVVHARRP